MCCDAKVFIDLCKLYPRSAELVKRDAEVRNQQLLAFRHSKRHQKLETDVHKRFISTLTSGLVEPQTKAGSRVTKLSQSVLVQALKRLRDKKRDDNNKRLVELISIPLAKIFSMNSSFT